MGGVPARSALHRLAVPSIRFAKRVTCMSEPADGDTRVVEPVGRVADCLVKFTSETMGNV